ncbi:MAG: ribosome silencing factor [Burkholderiales bacterium]|nr:ribosome silencing factor [Burkholderiales bacterium]
MDIRTLQSTIVEALDDIKARDILVFDTTGGTSEFDRVIIATAEVARQTKAMAMNVIEKVKAAGGRIVGMEGGNTGEWVLVDCVDAVVHIMQPATRAQYNLEELWGHKKVRVLTMADKARARAAQAAKKAAKEAQALVQKVQEAARKRVAAGAKKAAAKGKAVKKAVVKTAKKVVAKATRKVTDKPMAKVAAKAPVKKAAAKKVATKKAATNKTPAKKALVKKTPAKRLAAKKSPAKKAPVKKAVPAPRRAAPRR